MKQILLFLTIFLLTGGCTAKKPILLPVKSGYILSGLNNKNVLTIFDATTWKVLNQIKLPNSSAKNFSRDSQGRLWIGFSGGLGWDDNLVQIYSPPGELLKSIHLCNGPQAGITFAKGHAFVACAKNGEKGEIAVINQTTLTIEKSIELSIPENIFMLIASANDGETLVVRASTSTPKGEIDIRDASYAAITLIDTQSLEIKAQIGPQRDVDIWRILPYKKRFYLLNVGGWRIPRDQAKDVLILDPSNPTILNPVALAPSPVLGAIDKDVLYAYHNPTWNQPNNDPQRLFSRLNLVTGEKRVWNLPDRWDAEDMAIIDGQIILAKWDGSSGKEDGLYRFNMETGQLNQVLSVPDASGILYP